nr:odorant binding protein 17 [Trissolcus basalis]
MKVVLVAFVVIVAFASNAQGQKVSSIIQKVAKKCMKQTGVDKEQILEAVMTPTSEWDSNPEVTEAAKCFFICPLSMAFVLDENNCYNCEKGVKMTENFMKGPEMEEMGKCLVKGIKQCCPGLQRNDCCKNHYELIECMYPICGEIIAQQMTGLV